MVGKVGMGEKCQMTVDPIGHNGSSALCTPGQWFSKCGVWTSRITTTWEIVRHANHQALTQAFESGIQRAGPRNLFLNKNFR